MYISLFQTPSIFNFVFSLALCAIVLSKRALSKLTLIFMLLCLETFVWQFSWFISYFLQAPALKDLIVRIAWSAIVFIPFTFCQFDLEILGASKERKIINFGYFFAAVFLVLLWASKFLIYGYRDFGWGYYPLAGLLHPVYIFVVFCFITWTPSLLIKALNDPATIGLKRNQIWLVLFAHVLYYLAAIEYLINYGFGIFPIGAFFILLSYAVLAFAITKTRLMDISVVISRTVAEILTIIFLGTIYLGLVWLYQTLVFSGVDWLFLSWTVLYGILVGQIYQRTRLFIQTTSDKVFLRGKYDYYKELSDMTTQITRTLSMENILHTLHRAFFEVLEVSNPRIYLPEGFNKPEVKERLNVKEITFTGEDLIIPCLLEDRLIALIMLGKKLSEDPYTEEDIRLLKVLASQTAVALDHTRTYEQIKKDFESNQKKLYDAEKQLERSQRLASLGTLAAGVAHEIRNPMTVLRSKAQKLSDRLDDKGFLREYADLSIKHIDRILDIVRGMLDVSRTKEFERKPVNINALIEETFRFFSISRIEVVKRLNPVPEIQGDPSQLTQVFINLIQNAVRAMAGGGTLIVSTGVENGQIKVEITDTGSGIPAENLAKIFDPFFTTWPEGAGLGLATVHRIVADHGGRIEVKSKEGEGTTFIIYFPLH